MREQRQTGQNEANFERCTAGCGCIFLLSLTPRAGVVWFWIIKHAHHFVKDGGAVVGDGDLAIGADEQLVETARAEGAAQRLGDGAGRQDVRLGEKERKKR